MSDDKRYLLVLCEAANGAWRKVRGCVEVRGGKATRIDVEAEERPVWLDVMKAARVALGAEQPQTVDAEVARLDPRVSRLYDALRDYHHALDTRQHGGVAADQLVKAVETILGIPWTQGATLEAERTENGKNEKHGRDDS